MRQSNADWGETKTMSVPFIFKEKVHSPTSGKFNLARVLFSILFTLFLYFEITHLGRPPCTQMYSREIQTADIARNLCRHFSPLYPEVNFFGEKGKFVFLEFPLFSSVTALVSMISRLDIMTAGRVTAMFCFLLALYSLFRSLSPYGSKTALYLSLSFFLFTPLLLLQCSAVQPDIMMFAFYAMSYFTLESFRQKKNLSSWIYFCFASGFCIASKSSSVFLLGIPAVYGIFCTSGESGISRLRRAFLFFLIALLPLLFWRTYSLAKSLEFPNPFNSAGASLKHWFRPGLFLPDNPISFYGNVLYNLKYCFFLNRIPFFMETMMAVSCLSLPLALRRGGIFVPYFCSALIYACFFNLHMAIHYYYWLPFLLLLVHSLAALMQAFPYKGVVLFLSLWICFQADTGIRVALHEWASITPGPEALSQANTLKQIIPEDKLLLTSSKPPLTLLFNSERKGWDLNLNYSEVRSYLEIDRLPVPEMTQYLKDRFERNLKDGINYYAITDLENLAGFPWFIDMLLLKYPVVYYRPNQMIVFQIRK